MARSIGWCSLVFVLLLAPASDATCVWGSFNSSRLGYTDATLNGAAHTTLRGLIEGPGNTVAAGTDDLTVDYLGGVDVFYTSFLSIDAGVLDGSEQTALEAWVRSGGTLIVTANYGADEAYSSFTSMFHIADYHSVGTSGTVAPLASHAITEGVNAYSYAGEATFDTGTNALVLGENVNGDAFLALSEFSGGGRLLVVGDHSLFTDSLIDEADNQRLAQNIVAWACEPVVPEPASLTLLGLGLAGMALRRVRRR